MNDQNPAVPPVPPVPAPPADQPTVEERLTAAEARADEADAKLAEAAQAMIDAIKDADPDAVVRYAVYDTVYEKFVGPVLDRRPTKTQLVALIKRDASTVDDVADLEIREV